MHTHTRDRDKRLQHESRSLQSGRTGTGLQAGELQTRWHDGAVYARAYVQNAPAPAPSESAHKRCVQLEHAVLRERAAGV